MCDPATAALVGGGISGGGSLLGGLFGSSAAKSAAEQQAQAAEQAAQLQFEAFQQVQQNMLPFMTGGAAAFGALEAGLGLAPAAQAGMAAAPGGGTLAPSMGWGGGIGFPTSGATATAAALGAGAGFGPLDLPYSMTPQGASSLLFAAPGKPTMEALRATPGFQFALRQGLQATQSGYAAKGLASSGPALKGAANYAEGLASTTYGQQFNIAQQQYQNYLQQQQQIFNMLGGVANAGQSAAANTSSAALGTGANIGNLITSAGAAQAAGTIGSANALIGGFSGAGSGINSSLLMSALLPQLNPNAGMNAAGMNTVNPNGGNLAINPNTGQIEIQ